jgi:hypothetical protein
MSNRPFDVDDVERLVRLGPKELTWPEVCARAEISHEVADQLWRALGFPDDPPHESAYTADARSAKVTRASSDATANAPPAKRTRSP